MKTLIRVLLALAFALPLIASAQGFADTNALVISLSPERPGADQIVSVDVESYATDLQSATMGYMVNGALKKRGVGVKHFLFQTGKAGSVTVLTVIAQLPDGRTFRKEFKIHPADVMLLWQTSSYTPPFYKGKALFPFEGSATVVAIPLFVNAQGERLTERELVYTWKENGKVIGDASGFGKNLFALLGTVPIREKTISVEVETPDHTMLAASEITIPPVAPRLLLYENHPLYGILFNRALTAFSFTGDEVRFSAIPYFFETPSRESTALSYHWQANYRDVTSERGADITLRRASEKSGSASLFLEAQHNIKTFQAGDATLSIAFTAKPFGSAGQTTTEPQTSQ